MQIVSECFLLHRRPFRENSLWLDLFSREQGRLAAIAHGLDRKRSNLQACLQMFTPLTVQLRGRQDLLTMMQVEPVSVHRPLLGTAQICGFYVNELLVYTLPRFDGQPALFDTYQQTLQGLAQQEAAPPLLRRFELRLLTALGYGIDFDSAQGKVLEADRYYGYRPQHGFELCPSSAHAFLGQHLHALARQDFSQAEVLKAAKRLTHLALQPLLQGRTIHSRQLLRPYGQRKPSDVG